MTKPLRHAPIALAAALAAVLTAFAVPAHASPAALQKATSHCWLDVINDWLDNNRVDRTYAIPCYSQAIQHLNSLPDVTGYSSAIDDIHRAQLAALREERSNPSGGGSHGGSQQGPGGGVGPGSNGKGGGGGSGHGGGVLGIGNPSNATSVPLPLIVLGALAVLLALAGLATWGARRFQGRRPAPAPAVAKRR